MDPRSHSRITRLRERDLAKKKERLLEVPSRLIYGIEFHPEYEQNGFLYVFSNGPTGQSERKNRISRYSVDREGQQALSDEGSTQIVDRGCSQVVVFLNDHDQAGVLRRRIRFVGWPLVRLE